MVSRLPSIFLAISCTFDGYSQTFTKFGQRWLVLKNMQVVGANNNDQKTDKFILNE